MNYDWIIDGGYLPQFILRIGIRQQLATRLNIIKSKSLEEAYKRKMDFVSFLRSRPIASGTTTDLHNEQHYEVGTNVMAAFMEPRMKYSACLYPTGKETLAQAEIAMLELYVTRAQLKDGMSILDLGCGWGSAIFYFAEMFPTSQIIGFSNSSTQKQYIDSLATEKEPKNITTITGDIVDYEFEGETFDRIVSIEMFKHLKNYELLFAKVSRALKANGKLFVQILCHRDTPYDFEEGWMTTHFFTGGTMPSADLFLYFQKDLQVSNQWWISGNHYSRTMEDFLTKWNRSKAEVWPHLIENYGKENATAWFHRWQTYLTVGTEFFAYEGGDTWATSHYLFEKPGNM